MALSSTRATPRDGGIGGFTGPGGGAIRAAIGVASTVPSDGEPVVVSSVAEAESLLGIGPLRDFAVIDLSVSGGSIVCWPLARNAGGGPDVASVDMDLDTGEVAIDITGHALGQQEVVLEVVTGGAAGTAEFRLIVDGVAAASFTPSAGDYGAAYAVPAASLGSLATGVAAADRLMLDITAPTAPAVFVADNTVTWRMTEPTADSGSLADGVARLAQSERPWADITCCGCSTGAHWTAFDAAVRQLWTLGRFTFAGVQGPGHDARTGGTGYANFAAWVSALNAVSTYTASFERKDSPTTAVCPWWLEIIDPVSGRAKVVPGIYVAMALAHARLPWEPPEAFRHGRAATDPRTGNLLLDVRSIYGDPSDDQISAVDDRWYVTFRTRSGRSGVWLNFFRLWGEPGGGGVRTSDYDGVDRRRVMDLSAAITREVLQPFEGDTVTTDNNGRMANSAREHWRTVALGGFSGLLAREAITFADAIVTDMAPGVLRNKRVKVTIRITPLAKVDTIDIDLFFYVNAASSAEAA